jgi:hypothetical protein
MQRSSGATVHDPGGGAVGRATVGRLFMTSKFLSALVAGALVIAPTATFAQDAPAPAAETVSTNGGNALFGRSDMVIAGIYFTALIALILLEDEIFNNDDDDGEPVSP